MQLFNFNQSRSGVETRPSTTQILERTKLSKLTTLPRFELSKTDSEPTPAKSSTTCINCRRSLKSEIEFYQAVGACRSCLSIYNLIDSALNAAAERKSIAITRERFLSKLEAK